MNLKDSRFRWLAALLLALALAIAIYQATSGPGDELKANAPSPIGQELHDSPPNGVAPPPASAPISPLEFLLSHQNRRASAGQTIPNVPANFNEPARAAAEIPDTTAHGPPNQFDRSSRPIAQGLANETPSGIPIRAEIPGPDSEALRYSPPPAPTPQR